MVRKPQVSVAAESFHKSRLLGTSRPSCRNAVSGPNRVPIEDAILANMAFGWRSLLDRLSGSRGNTPAVSFVLLESRFEPLPDDLLLDRAKSAYESAKPSGVEVLTDRTATSRVLRVENFYFAIHQAQQQYSRPSFETIEVIRQAWNSHVCWSSLDWASPALEEKDKQGARKIMLRLVELLWSANTTGLFFPDHGLTIPNMGTLGESIRWARRNGVPVHELFPPVISPKPPEKTS